jgi:alpha-L-rhamnosidase
MSSSARWIWTPRREYVNQHVYFRKRFELSGAPESALLRITADTRFHLYVNGKSALRGPMRGYPHALPLDEIDIAPFLKAGANVIAVHVLSFGVSTGLNVFRDRAGLFAEGSVRCAGGTAVEIETNHTWRYSEAAAYRRFVSRSSSQLGFQEHLDAAREESGDWRSPEFDDSRWQKPHLLGAAGVLPWRTLQPRTIPPLDVTLRAPVAISGQYEAADLLPGASVEDAGNVTAIASREQRTPGKEGFEKAEALTGGGTAKILPLPAGRCAALVVDFGETRYGHPTLKVEGTVGGEIFDLLYDEQISDSGLELISLQTPCSASDYCLGDRLICRPGIGAFESLQPRGFRYMMLIARNIRRPVTLTQLGIQEATYPVVQRGSFSCSDPRLTKIWETGVRTLRHCMADAYMDCPRRQEQGWAATRVAGMAALYALGDTALYRRGLQMMAQSAQHVPDGLMLGVIPSERPDCVILDYCLHWVLALHEFYQFTGDLEMLKEQRPALEKVLGFFSIHAGERGLLGPTTNYSLFLDTTPGLDRGNLSATFNLLYLQALLAATQLGKALGETGMASHCERNAKALSDRVFMVFASSRRSLLVETVEMRTGEPGDLVSQHATALAVLSGVLGKRDYDRTGPAADVLKDFLPPPGSDVTQGPVRANLFFRAYVHEALAILGHGNVALEDIRRTWGFMLDQGATTFWERLPMRPGSSRCHAWSVHPTTYLSRHVLGLSPSAPGWKRFRVQPHAFDLTHAEGKVPTPHGEISIRWKREGDRPPKVELRVPEGCEAEFAELDRKTVVLKAGEHSIG